MKHRIESFFDRLWPINRSLTGNGNRETLKILSEIVDISISEIPSGTKCFDWSVPSEWNVKEAWIKNSKDEIIIDFSKNNLHLLGYSEPFSGVLSYDQLKEKIYTLPDQPKLIPYLTSYYKRRWGFCMAHEQFLDLDQNEKYSVFIDSTLDDSGSMTIGEALIHGNTDKEILFSTYICHPSLANNELSGPLVCSFLYDKLKEKKDLRYSYRFAFVPETIGSISLLSTKGDFFKENLIAGFVVTCIGDGGNFTYKKSRDGDSLVDRATELILAQSGEGHNIIDFFPSGSDERQYCSPGFNLPVGSLMRTMYGIYPEYHTSADNKDLISFSSMETAVDVYLDVIQLIEKNDFFINLFPNCEPQLGKRGLYPDLGSQKTKDDFVRGMMWILNLSDGKHDLIDISKRSKISVKELYPILDVLIEKAIIVRK